jgi:integrase
MASTCGNDQDWLFPSSRRRGSASLSPIGQTGFRNGVLKPAAKRAGISDLDMLTLRRTCAAHFGQKASAKDAQAQMRLSNPLTPFRYSPERLSESLMRAAMALEGEIFAKVEPHFPRGETTNQVAPAILRTLSERARTSLAYDRRT